MIVSVHLWTHFTIIIIKLLTKLKLNARNVVDVIILI